MAKGCSNGCSLNWFTHSASFQATLYWWCDLKANDGLTEEDSDGLTKYVQKVQFGIGFEIENEIEGQCWSSPKLIRILTVLRYILGPNLGILTSIGGELSCGQAQNGVNFYFKFNLIFKVKVNELQNNRDLNQCALHFWSKSGDSSVNGWQVIAEKLGVEAHTGTQTQTDAGNDNTRRPKLASGKNG